MPAQVVTLPMEVLENILAYLPYKTLETCTLTNRILSIIARRILAKHNQTVSKVSQFRRFIKVLGESDLIYTSCTHDFIPFSGLMYLKAIDFR